MIFRVTRTRTVSTSDSEVLQGHAHRRQAVARQPREDYLVYGGVQSYPPRSGAPNFEVMPADKALVLQTNGEIHVFAIDSFHHYCGPAGLR